MSDEADYGLVMPFWIDTPGYTDRDKEMFVCGVEFQMLYEQLKDGWRGERGVPIHTENESRVRLMCGKMGLQCECLPLGAGWSSLKVTEDGNVAS